METNQIVFRKKPIVLDNVARDYLVSEKILDEDNFIYDSNPAFDDCKDRVIYGSVIALNFIPVYRLLQCKTIMVVKDDEIETYNIN